MANLLLPFKTKPPSSMQFSKNHILFFLFHEYLVGQFQANKAKEMLPIGIVALTC
jgi:hypothetical protein